MEEHANLLTTAGRRLTDQTSHRGEDKDLSCDATRIVEEVNALSSLFCQRLVTRKLKQINKEAI